MKKYSYLLLISLLIFTLTACASQAKAPVAMLTKAAPVPSSTVQNLYTNEKLSFSFAIPDSWENENYSPVVTTDAIEETWGDPIKYTKVDFVFQNDKDNPLLSVMLVSKTWWDKLNKEEGPTPDYLGTKGDIVYCCVLPQSCPYEVGTKADLYNSMVLLHEDVPKRFKIIGGDSSSKETISTIEGVLEEGMMHTVVIKTDDGRTLAFSKDDAEKVNLDGGLIIGCRLKIYYRGTISGTDTSKVAVTKLEKLK